MGKDKLPLLGWGCGLVDVDNDGWRDVFIVNGHIHDNIEQFDDVGKYAQPKQLFRNERYGVFSDMSSQSGPALTIPQVSRGAAFGDYDNDGDTDVIINNLHSSATLLRNGGGNVNGWVRVVVQPPVASVGARVWLETPDRRRQSYEIHSGGSYASSSDTRPLFGIGTAESAKIWVEWRDGTRSEVVETSARRTLIFSPSASRN